MPTRPADLRWAAYARYSDRGQDRSVEQQIAEFRTYSADHGLSLPQRASRTERASRETERLKIKLLTVNRSLENLLAAIEGAAGRKSKPGSKADGGAPRSLVEQLDLREAEREKIRNELFSQPPPMAAEKFDLDEYCAGIQAQLVDEDMANRVRQAIVEKVTIAHSHDVAAVKIIFRCLPE